MILVPILIPVLMGMLVMLLVVVALGAVLFGTLATALFSGASSYVTSRRGRKAGYAEEVAGVTALPGAHLSEEGDWPEAA
jgi:hypothetical protein